MAKQIKIDTKSVKTYKTIANLEKAVDKFDHRYVVMTADNGRYYALFLGNDAVHVVWHGHAVA